jgi:hypothetical protein
MNFYVYEHTRNDTGLVFYVGKGSGQRLNIGKFGKDNPMYGFKQSKKARKGMSDNCCMKRPEVVAKISGANSLLAKTVEYDGQIFKTINDLAKHLGINRSTLGVRMHRNPEKYGIKVVGKTKELDKGEYYAGYDLTPFEHAVA